MAHLNVPLSAIPNTQVRRAIAVYKGVDDTDSETGLTHPDTPVIGKKRKVSTTTPHRASTPLVSTGFKSPRIDTTAWLDF